MPQCQVLIAKPGISVSTRMVYENLHANDLRPNQHPDIDGMVEAIRNQDFMQAAGKMGNVLELVTAEKYPVISQIKQVMREKGAVNALMSGSGPTVFGLFSSPKLAREAYEELRYGASSSLAKQVYLTDFYHANDRRVKNDSGSTKNHKGGAFHGE